MKFLKPLLSKSDSQTLKLFAILGVLTLLAVLIVRVVLFSPGSGLRAADTPSATEVEARK